jgi:hypothetical protein
MPGYKGGVLLVDWENLSSCLISRGKVVNAKLVEELWQYANRQCDGQVKAHMAAAHFDETIATAMRKRVITRNDVNSTKEQADIQLTVLAMDYVHQGCRRFILVTGDQDFIPLILRLREDTAEVMVIYGDPSRLAVELRQTLHNAVPGLESADVGTIIPLQDIVPDSSCRSLVGLLELQRRGIILGGPDRFGRTATLARWGILENEDTAQYWMLVNAICERIPRKDAAIRSGNRWEPTRAERTYLDLGMGRYADVRAIDYALRSLSSRPKALGALHSGPFLSDDGSQLSRVIEALVAVELVRKGADNAYSTTTDDLEAGYLEPLWRVYAAVSSECYRREERTIPFGQVEPLLGRGGIGQGRDQRAAGRISAAVNYAKAAGVIDAVAVNGCRHAIATNSALCRSFEHAYHEFYRAFLPRVSESIPELDVLRFMEDRDRDKSDPVFGFDSRDRHRILRILKQSQLIGHRDGYVTLRRSRWGDSGAA